MGNKFLLVRAPRSVIDESEVGYGWSNVDFSKYKSSDDLIDKGFKGKGISYGRKKNQITKYFNLSSGDIVVVPVSGAIAIAKVNGNKAFKTGIKYGENRVSVSYLGDRGGNIYIPRSVLSTKLQSRLKIRMAISDLSDFRDELEKHISSLTDGVIHTWKREVTEREEKQEADFKKKLLDRLRSGKDISLSAGGYGLEKLVSEILEANGYESRVQAKNQSSDISDVDVISKRYNELTGDLEILYIQVKHHSGVTNRTGLEQLVAYNDNESSLSRKILISTAKIDSSVQKEAESLGVVTIDGEEFVSWLYNNIEKLSIKTKGALGVSSIPQLI